MYTLSVRKYGLLMTLHPFVPPHFCIPVRGIVSNALSPSALCTFLPFSVALHKTGRVDQPASSVDCCCFAACGGPARRIPHLALRGADDALLG